jgi:hypothetical protein
MQFDGLQTQERGFLAQENVGLSKVVPTLAELIQNAKHQTDVDVLVVLA